MAELKIKIKIQEEDEEALTPSRRSLFRSASWTARSSPKSTPNLKPKPARRLLPPPLPPLLRPPSLTSWPLLHPDDSTLLTSRPNSNRECSRITDHLYLGSEAVAKDRDALRCHGITHVLNCVGSRCPEYFRGDLIYKTLFLNDSPSEDITSILYDVFDYLEEVRLKPKSRVFVHCVKGASRSAAIVIAYLMWSNSKSFSDALDQVRSARAVTDPNLGFASQLLQCQSRVHALPPSPNSILRVYRMAPHSAYDPLHLVPKAVDRLWVDKFDSRGAFLVVHVRDGIFVWVGKYCESGMAASALAAAKQVVKYENMRVSIVTLHEGSETSEFWNLLIGEDQKDLGGNRRVQMYDLDFEIYKRALKGGILPSTLDTGSWMENSLPARESGWNKVRKKFLNEDQENDKEQEQKEQFCSPNSVSGESSVTSADSASPLSSFSPSSSCSLDWHNGSPSGLGSYSYTPPLPVVVSNLPPLYSRKMKTKKEENDSFSSSRPIVYKSGSNPPSLVLLPRVECGPSTSSSTNSPADIVGDWCLSPPFAPNMEQATSSGHDEDDGRCSEFNHSDYNWLIHPILFQWPSMDKIEEINSRVLDSKSVFLLLASDISSRKSKTTSNVLYIWVGNHSQFNGKDGGDGDSAGSSENLQIIIDSVRAKIDPLELPIDISVQMINEEEEPEEFLDHLFSFHGEKDNSYR